MRVVVGMSGSSGAILGIRAIERLTGLGVEVHLVMSKRAELVTTLETDYTVAKVRGLATEWYRNTDYAAAIASGSFLTNGMLIVPCSVRTAAEIAGGHGDNLLCRSADVTLKERRPLVLVVREAPLSPIHLRNLMVLAEAGATIFPPVPAFYSRPESVGDLVDYMVVRILDELRLHTDSEMRWTGRARPQREP